MDSSARFHEIDSLQPIYEWHNVTDNAPFAARDGGGALTFKGQMWLLGGWNPLDPVNFPKVCNNEVWSSVDGKDWTLVLKNAPWEGRHCSGYVVHKEKMWIVGGDPNQGYYMDDVWCSEDGRNWTEVRRNAPWGPRVLSYTVTFQGKIWVMGGQTLPQAAPAEEIFYRDVWNSIDGETWEQVTDDVPWAPRGLIGGSAVFKDRMWIIGGGTYDTPQVPQRICYNDVWSSADGVQWTQQTNAAPWQPREFNEVAVWDNKLWLLEGGIPGIGNTKDVWYSSDGAQWTEVPDTPWAPRHAASVFVHDDALWIVAGNNMTPDVWKLTRKR